MKTRITPNEIIERYFNSTNLTCDGNQSDCEIIQNEFLNRFHKLLTLEQIEHLWRNYSNRFAAGFLSPNKKDIKNFLNGIEYSIERLLEEENEDYGVFTDVDYIPMESIRDCFFD